MLGQEDFMVIQALVRRGVYICDIARQLGLSAPKQFIKGFRRDNLAIEVVTAPAAVRFDIAATLLAREPLVLRSCATESWIWTASCNSSPKRIEHA